MQIVYGVNSGYLFPALISIYSIWKNATRSVEVVLYGEGLSDADTWKVYKVRELLMGGGRDYSERIRFQRVHGIFGVQKPAHAS